MSCTLLPRRRSAFATPGGRPRQAAVALLSPPHCGAPSFIWKKVKTRGIREKTAIRKIFSKEDLESNNADLESTEQQQQLWETFSNEAVLKLVVPTSSVFIKIRGMKEKAVAWKALNNCGLECIGQLSTIVIKTGRIRETIAA
ncbi:hypothetical protein PUN28_000246 [Cardiocondyla obscurior]|uniref:Uncharacterized protein n=1 Tax=Cardiocondyla obscurior TaxID=286306 RepID=A0AAW2GYC8_9HYME